MSAQAPPADLFRSEHMRRRRIVNAIVEGAATLSALLAVAVLVIVVGSVVSKGLEGDQRRLLHEDAGALHRLRPAPRVWDRERDHRDR